MTTHLNIGYQHPDPNVSTEVVIACEGRTVMNDWKAPKNWQFMVGMVARGRGVIPTTERGVIVWVGKDSLAIMRQGASSPTTIFQSDTIPELSHPATLGCLLALVRDVWGDPGLAVVGRYSHAGTTWQVVGGHPHGGRFNRMAAVAYSAETAALLAALEAAP